MTALWCWNSQCTLGSKESYTKAKELDTKGNYEREIITGLGLVQTTAGNQGITDYTTENYTGLQRSLT